MFCGTPAVVYYTFGVFLPDILANTHWSAAGVAAAIGPGALIVAISAPVVGRLSDTYGVRPLALIGGPAFGIGIALLGVGPHSSAAFTGFTMLMYLLAFAGSPIAYAHTMTGWFDRRRGMALGVIFCCGAIGIAVWPSYAALLIARLGWRHAFVVMGATAGGIIFLSGLLLLKNVPAGSSSADGHDRPAGTSAGEAIRTSRFWKTAAIFALLSAVLGGMAVQFPVILRQQGATAQVAASIMSVVGICMFLGRLLLGFVLDRWFAPHITIGITVVSMLAFVTMLLSASSPALFAAAAFVGFGMGSEYAIAAYMVSRAFGFRAYGAIYGLISLATGVGLAVGPAVIGVLLVIGVAAHTIFLSALALLILSVLILMSLGKKDLPFGSVPASRM
jgi:MFS family permease